MQQAANDLSRPAGGATSTAPSSQSPEPATATTAGPLREIFGFALAGSLSDPGVGYPSWNFSLLSTVAFFGLHINDDGTIASDSGLTVWNSSDLTNLVATARSHGVKVVVTVILQDFSAGTPHMCAGLASRSTVVSQTVAQVNAKGVDGVNIDFEGLNGTCPNGQTARSMMTDFAHQMRTALPAGAYLSVDTYAGSAADSLGFFDIPGLSAYVDSFFVMAYDLEYSNYSHAPTNCTSFCLGPTAPLAGYYYNDTTTASQYLSVVPASRIILGVPYYGRKACVASTVPNAYPTGSVSADTYLTASVDSSSPEVQPGSYAVHRDANDPAGQERWDTWFNTSLNCNRELYWDDTVSLARKYDLVNGEGLRGVGIWNLTYGGGAPELWSLLATHFSKCASATLDADPASPQTPGTSVLLTATASCPATATYRFWLRPPGGSWRIVQDYNTTSTFTWSTRGLVQGIYGLEVDVRDQGATVSYEAIANLSYTLATAPCATPTLSANPASPGPTGATVTFNAATSGCPNPTYRFWIRPPGGPWSVVQGYSATSTYAWSAPSVPGTYGVEVDVKDQSSTASYDTVTNIAYTLSACAGARLTTDKPSPQTPGTLIQLSATAACPGTPAFRFWIRPPAGAWRIVQDYGPTSTYTWNTTGLAPGVYSLEVDVRNQGSTASYESVANLSYTLAIPPCSTPTLTAAPASPQASGTKVTLNATTSGCPNPRYRFWVQPPGGAWSIVQDYSPNSSYAWANTGLAGTYALEVDVRDQSSTASYDAVNNISYRLTACSGASLTPDQPSPQPVGISVTLSATATCQGTAQYRFWIRPPGGAWTIVQDYGTASTYRWNTAGSRAGTYGLEVDVRNQGSTPTYETVANQSYVLNPQ